MGILGSAAPTADTAVGKFIKQKHRNPCRSVLRAGQEPNIDSHTFGTQGLSIPT